MEVEISWVEVDEAGWSWVEVDRTGWSWVHGLVIPIKEFHLDKRKLHLNKKGNSAFAKKFIASYKQDRLIFFAL